MKPARHPVTSATSNPTREELSLHMPLVYQVAARMLRRLPPNVLREDLVAAGTIGLLDALRKCEGRDGAFEWYARIRIRGAMVDELRAQDWLSRRARKRLAKAEASGDGGSMSVVGIDDLSEAAAAGLADVGERSPYEQVESRGERAALERAIATLCERDANLVRWHYFEGVAFKDIAARFGVSEPRVSQLHARAMERLRAVMAESETRCAA